METVWVLTQSSPFEGIVELTDTVGVYSSILRAHDNSVHLGIKWSSTLSGTDEVGFDYLLKEWRLDGLTGPAGT